MRIFGALTPFDRDRPELVEGLRTGFEPFEGGMTGTGTETRAGVYDESYTFYSSTCP